MKRLLSIFATLLPLALLAAGCGGSDSPANETPPTTAGFPEPHIEVKQRPEPKIKDREGPPPTKLIIRDLIMGKGPGAKDGDMLTVAYRSEYYVSGDIWSSSWEHNSPLRLELGAGTEGEGFEKGLRGMKLGGRREFIIPPRFIYERPFGTSKEDTLIYVIDLLAID